MRYLKLFEDNKTQKDFAISKIFRIFVYYCYFILHLITKAKKQVL